MSDLVTIKKIRTADGDHLIDAAYLDGHTFGEIESMVHGGIETYVIPLAKSSVQGYTAVVNSPQSILTISKTLLDMLIDRQANGGYKLGDVILIEATSDGTKVFDRWISKVEGNNITLAVLETQVATHHHKINISSSSDKALTGVSTSSTVTLTSVGAAVSVITSAVGTFVTSVSYDENGSDDLVLSSSSASGSVVSHSHTVTAHSHSFTPSSLVSQTASAYTSLTSAKHNIHSHTIVSAAGESTIGTAFDIATGVSTSDTFIKNLTDSTSQTTGANAVGLTANANTAALSTSTQNSTDAIGNTVKTTSAGAHTHTVSTTTTSNVVTGVTVATSVVTSVNFTAPTVATSVVTSAYLSVDGSGVLSLSAPRGSQSVGSFSVSRVAQSYTSGQVGATGSAASNGSHQHGFSHTHAIPSHTHSIDSHTHTYVKTVASETGSAITSLSTSSYTPHSHSNNINAASTITNSTEVNIVTGGDQTKVVRNLKTADFSTGTSSPTTDTKYVALVGEIVFPGITCGTASVSTSTSSITPAVAGEQTALTSITFTSANFVKTVTSGSDIKTSTNIGGNQL